MNRKNELIASAARSMASGNFPAPKAAPQVQLDPASVDVVNRLFSELQAIFPAWRQAWPNDKALAAAKRSWVRGFMAAGIRDLEQIRYGLQQCRATGSDFAPSVGKFIEWCRPTPEAMGIPAVEQAYLQACRLAHPAANRSGAHPAVWHAACEVGLIVLCVLPEQKSRPLFERAYGITVDMLLRGEPLREIPKALPETVSIPASPERARSALNEMRRRLAGSEVVA